jgi:hypothetical protein
MGMDEVEIHMLRFLRELTHLQESLEASIADVRRNHEAVAPLWDDAMRRQYDQAWVPLEDAMKNYVRRVGPELNEFLRTKSHYLERYLHGPR